MLPHHPRGEAEVPPDVGRRAAELLPLGLIEDLVFAPGLDGDRLAAAAVFNGVVTEPVRADRGSAEVSPSDTDGLQERGGQEDEPEQGGQRVSGNGPFTLSRKG